MLDTFLPLCRAVQGVDLADPAAAERELTARLDPFGEAGRALAADMKRLLADEQLCQNGEMPVRWGRVAKPSEETLGFSIDVVLMDGAGPLHVHPEGEVSFAVTMDGAPRFDGHPEGWVVLPPGSQHVPTVEGGTMLIAYVLPEGKIEFVR